MSWCAVTPYRVIESTSEHLRCDDILFLELERRWLRKNVPVGFHGSCQHLMKRSILGNSCKVFFFLSSLLSFGRHLSFLPIIRDGFFFGLGLVMQPPG